MIHSNFRIGKRVGGKGGISKACFFARDMGHALN